jgi:hypothetical protein
LRETPQDRDAHDDEGSSTMVALSEVHGPLVAEFAGFFYEKGRHGVIAPTTPGGAR